MFFFTWQSHLDTDIEVFTPASVQTRWVELSWQMYVVCRPADIVNSHTSKEREIKIYVRFLLVARPMILVREDHIRAMP